jgi:hypothetical protein
MRRTGVKYPVHLCAGDPDDQCIQRVVLAAFGPEPVRKTTKVFLVDRVQHCDGRSLDNFVFEGDDREWALSAIRFQYVPSLARQCPVCSPLDPSVQILEVTLEVFLVVLPCQPIHSGCRILPKIGERDPE